MFYRTSVSIKVIDCQDPGKNEGSFLSRRLNVLSYLPGFPGFIIAQTNRQIVRPEVTKQVIAARAVHLRQGSVPAFTWRQRLAYASPQRPATPLSHQDEQHNCRDLHALAQFVPQRPY